VLKLACLVSLVNVCLHTPRTLQLLPNLGWVLLLLDGLVVAVFTGEACARANNLGFIRVCLTNVDFCQLCVNLSAAQFLSAASLVPIRLCAAARPLGLLAASHLPDRLQHTVPLSASGLLPVAGCHPLCPTHDNRSIVSNLLLLYCTIC
jgi:hypothetical protein